MAVTARQTPDFRTISDFRKRHLSALGGLFTQVLQLCQKAGLVRLGHVALDGTKIRANASKASDAREDAAYGVDKRGDCREWVTNKQRRLEKIRAAKAVLEADAQDDARSKLRKVDYQTDRPRRGRSANHLPGTPHAYARTLLPWSHIL